MDRSAMHFSSAQKVMPGGVTAAARLDRRFNRPFVVSRADGSELYDLEGNPYIDMCTSFGASLLGHGHPRIVEALSRAGRMGIACGMEFRAQVELAEKICAAVPSAEMVRYTLSGTETTWYAVRLARVYTGRKKIIKLEGHFHGYNDYLQFNYWPRRGESLPNVRAESPGFPPESRDNIVVLPYNDFGALEQAIGENPGEIAAVILEPVNFNAGGIQPRRGYLENVRALTERHGIVLVFDEILSGFRTGKDCMQGYYAVMPDLTTLGKALGGGVPLSVFAGRREIMRYVAPEGAMMHSGTYNAHAVNILCGEAFMELVGEAGFYDSLLRRSAELYRGLNEAFAQSGIPARAHGLGSRFGLLFGDAARAEPISYADVIDQDWQLARSFFLEAFRLGVYFNWGWHHGISSAHTDEDIVRVVDVAAEAARRAMSNR